MEVKLYVGNLPYDTTEEELRELFGQAGGVSTVEVIKDRDTGTSKGFAFVTMNSQEDANNAIQQMNGRSIGNREMRVSVARPREDRPSGGFDRNRGGGNRGGGGGYRSGGGGDRDRGRSGGGRRY